MLRTFIAGGILVMSVCSAAQAQLSPAAKMSEAAANQLGILEYCQAQGHASPEAVAAERSAMARAPSTNLSTVKAEELGKQGVLASPDGQTMKLAEMASSHGSTVPALCKELADSALEFQTFVSQHPPAAQ